MTKGRQAGAAVDECDEGPEDAIDRVEKAWRREHPEIDVSSIGIISRIWRIGRHLERERKDELTKLGTDRVTVDVLAMLRRAGPPFRLTAGDLTHHSLITPGGVSQRLSKLEKLGMVKREFHPTDRRRIEVELTPAGVDLIDSVLEKLMTHESTLLEGLSDEDQRSLRLILKRLLARFEDPADEGPSSAGTIV